MPLPRTLKKCLVCGVEYSNGKKSADGACPACGTPEVESKTFKFVFQQKPYDEMNFIPMHIDNGCGVARAFNDGQAQCIECPFERKCLMELRHTWQYYAQKKDLVAKIFKLIDDGQSWHGTASKLDISKSTVDRTLMDRDIIEPIYRKLKGKDLTKIEGPKQ